MAKMYCTLIQYINTLHRDEQTHVRETKITDSQIDGIESPRMRNTLHSHTNTVA